MFEEVPFGVEIAGETFRQHEISQGRVVVAENGSTSRAK